MIYLSRSIAIGLAALLLGSCGSADKAPAGTKTDTTFAALDTAAVPPDTSTGASSATSSAAADSVGASTTATTGPATTSTPTAATSPMPAATKERAPTPAAVPSAPTSPKHSETTPPRTPAPTPTPTPTPTPAPTPPPAPPPTPAPPPETAGNRQNDPKTIFQNEKCGACHTVTAQGINGDGARDLSTVGNERSFDWIMRFLNKQEMIDGKKHKKTWKGSDEDQKTIARWLSGLK